MTNIFNLENSTMPRPTIKIGIEVKIEAGKVFMFDCVREQWIEISDRVQRVDTDVTAHRHECRWESKSGRVFYSEAQWALLPDEYRESQIRGGFHKVECNPITGMFAYTKQGWLINNFRKVDGAWWADVNRASSL